MSFSVDYRFCAGFEQNRFYAAKQRNRCKTGFCLSKKTGVRPVRALDRVLNRFKKRVLGRGEKPVPRW
jgi:hypothetical protein